jgi:thiamine-phosphate pyrophosphorylase
MSMLSHEGFYPPADELLEAAVGIRRRLGDWAAASTPWRICLATPDAPRTGDLILGGADDAFGEGVGVLQATTNEVVLRLNDVRYALEGKWSDDWLSALAAFLDCGFEPHDALVLALAWRPENLELQDAWPVDFATFPKLAGLPPAPVTPFPKCPDRLGLYPVLPSAEWVERVLDLGVETAQLRYKGTEPVEKQREIERAVTAGRKHAARLFINDHWREAIAAGAYGVHLGQEDVQVADLDAIARAGLRLGLSTHGYYEMLYALHVGPSYLALGAVFPTTTKIMPTAPQGLSRLARYVQLLDGVVPLVAIGGVDKAVLTKVLATGVGSAAVVRAVTEAADTAAAVSALQHDFAR